ncbi:MAG TPA: hypothetical protein VET26_07235 [Candidatus Sulfotelmatobacter sp.]|nr:hypothetical protein [Candidatus Sulfotelmatobacter sp.]
MDPISLLFSGAAGAALAALVGRNREHRLRPAGLADELNWAFLVDDGVVLQKDGALLAAFRYRGPDLGSATAAELDALAAQLNDALLPYTDGWMFHVDAIRFPAPAYSASAFPNLPAAWIDAERRAAFRSARPQFVSEYTLCVTYLPSRDVYSRAAAAFVQGAPRGVDWSAILGAFRAAVEGLEQRLAARLYMERLDADALVSHLHRCFTGLAHPVSAPPYGAYLNTVLASQELVGGFAPRVGDLHLRLVAITGYPRRASAGRLDFLNALPFPYRWSSRFIPLGQQAAGRLIKRHQQRWFMGRRGVGSFLGEIAGGAEQGRSERRQRQEEELFHDQDAVAMARDAAEASAENASGAVRFGLSTQLVVVADEEPDRALERARAVRTALQDNGVTARIETMNAVDAFFGTLPGHGYPNLRRPLLSSANAVDLWPVTSVWPGLARNPSPFFPRESPPLMHVATDGSTPFRLNLHVGDVGHTLVVGATGAGKSTFVGLTVAQWQRYERAQLFVFDVGYSHWLFAQAAGAQHYDVAAGRLDAVAFQPLADIDNPTERAWAAGWLEMLLELQGVAITPQRRLRLERALSLLADESREFRTLTELTVQLQDADLADALRPYTVGGAYGRLLDADRDAVGAGRHQVFELKHLMDMDDKVLVPVLLYLFRRVERQLDGGPALIVIEELWAPLMRTVFANRIKQWLLTLRKQNAAVMLVAHSLAQLEQVPAKQVIVDSCPTRILLPNAEAGNSANARLYRDLGLNSREVAIVAGATPKRDYYVKSPLGSRVVQLDLGPVALAFLGTPAGMTLDAVRPVVEALIAREGERWSKAWLEQLGVQAPVFTSEDAVNAGPTGEAPRMDLTLEPVAVDDMGDDQKEDSSYVEVLA